MKKPSEADQELIRALASLLHDSDLTEIEFEKDGVKVRVARQIVFSAAAAAAAAAPPAAVAAPAGADSPAPPVDGSADPAQHPGAVKSPMVGTAYLAAEPGARPFTDIGQLVQENQTVMIVEAMKTMNQIPAPRSGKVVAILVSDGQPVEYGEPLLVIE